MQRIILLSIGMFALGLDAYVIAGLLSQMCLTFHASLSELGQTVSIFTLCYAISAPLFASILAGKSVNKILILALVVFTIGNLMSALSTSLMMLLLGRAIAGTGAGLFSPIAVASAVALAPSHKRGKALSMILGGMSIGVVIGVPVGLLIAQHLGWQATFWTVASLGGIALLGIIFGFPAIHAGTPPTFAERIAMLTDRRVTMTIAITFLTSIASLGLYTYVAPIIHTILGQESSVTTYFWAWGVGGIIGSFSIGALIDRTKSPIFLMLIILMLLTFAIFTFIFGLKVALAGYALCVLWGAVGWASQAPQQHTLLALHPKNGASLVALNSSANYLGSSVGAALGGVVLWAGLPIGQLPLAAGCVALLAFVGQIYIWVKHRAKQPITLSEQKC